MQSDQMRGVYSFFLNKCIGMNVNQMKFWTKTYKVKSTIVINTHPTKVDRSQQLTLELFLQICFINNNRVQASPYDNVVINKHIIEVNNLEQLTLELSLRIHFFSNKGAQTPSHAQS